MLTCYSNHHSMDEFEINKLPITIEIIAGNLSRICRFAGSCPKFYSVAEHCVLVSSLLVPGNERLGLMHDAHEAYIGDIKNPVADVLCVNESLHSLKKSTDKRIYSYFKIYSTDYALEKVYHADKLALEVEMYHFFECFRKSVMWPVHYIKMVEELGRHINCFSPEKARENFLEVWKNGQI